MSRNQLFHGTSAPTSEITPGRHDLSTYGTNWSAYATSDEDMAWRYAESSWSENDAHLRIGGDFYSRVYRVTPKTPEDVVPDRNHRSDNPTVRWESPSGFDVVSELSQPRGTQGRLFAVEGRKYADTLQLERDIAMKERTESGTVENNLRRHQFVMDLQASGGASPYVQPTLEGEVPPESTGILGTLDRNRRHVADAEALGYLEKSEE